MRFLPKDLGEGFSVGAVASRGNGSNDGIPFVVDVVQVQEAVGLVIRVKRQAEQTLLSSKLDQVVDIQEWLDRTIRY